MNCGPRYSFIRNFGCLCCVNNRLCVKDKFCPCYRECIFIGYASGKNGWRLYDLYQKVFFKSRDIIFIEHIFHLIQPSQACPLDFGQFFPKNTFLFDTHISSISILQDNTHVTTIIHAQIDYAYAHPTTALTNIEELPESITTIIPPNLQPCAS